MAEATLGTILGGGAGQLAFMLEAAARKKSEVEAEAK
jgi:hypothetical protein